MKNIFLTAILVCMAFPAFACRCPDINCPEESYKSALLVQTDYPDRNLAACATEKSSDKPGAYNCVVIVDCYNDNIVRTFYDITYDVNIENGNIIVTSYLGLSRDINLRTDYFPFERSRFLIEPAGTIKEEKQYIFDPPEIDSSFRRDVFSLYKKYDKGDWGSTNLAFMLADLALLGDKQAEKLLYKMRTDFSWDGIDAEIYSQTLEFYEQYKKMILNHP